MNPSRSDEELFIIADRMYAEFRAQRLVKDRSSHGARRDLSDSFLTMSVQDPTVRMPSSKRVHHFRNYPKCFVGEQAVQWMLRPGGIANVACIEDALVLGRQLMEIGTFHHVVYEHTFKNAFLYYRFTTDDKVPRTVGQQLTASLPSTLHARHRMELDPVSKERGTSDSSFTPLKLQESTNKHRVVFAGHLQALQHRVATLATDFAFTRSVTEIFAEDAQEMQSQLANAHSGIGDLCVQMLAIQSQFRALLVLTATLSVAVVVCGSFAGICLTILFAGWQPAEVIRSLWCVLLVFIFTLLLAMAAAMIWLPQHLSAPAPRSLLHLLSLISPSGSGLTSLTTSLLTPGTMNRTQSTLSATSAASCCDSVVSQSNTSHFSASFFPVVDTSKANLAPSSPHNLHSSGAATAKHFSNSDHNSTRAAQVPNQQICTGLSRLSPVGLISHPYNCKLDSISQSSTTSAPSEATSEVTGCATDSSRPKRGLQAIAAKLRQKASNLLMSVQGTCSLTATPSGTHATPDPSSLTASLPVSPSSRCTTPSHSQQQLLPSDLTRLPHTNTTLKGQSVQTTLQLRPLHVLTTPTHNSQPTEPCPSPASHPNNNNSPTTTPAASASAAAEPARTAAEASPPHQPMPQTASPPAHAHTAPPGTPVGRCFPGPTPSLQALHSSECSPLLFLPNTHASPDLTVLGPIPHSPTSAGRASPSGCQAAVGDPPSLPINGSEPIRFENDLFQGTISLYIAGLDSSPDALFEGKKRRSWVAVQGRFKTLVAVNSVTTGQEFAHPFQKLPAPWFVDKVLLQLARKISPSMRMGDLSAPHMLIPMLAAAQIVNVCQEGDEVPPLDVVEDLRLWDPTLSGSGSESGSPLAATARQRRFMNAKNCEGKTFDTNLTWTFHFWQQHVDMASYSLRFGYMYDLSKHLGGQPLLIMAKDEQSGKYLYNFAVWHERLFPAQQQAGRHRAATSSTAASPASGTTACNSPNASHISPGQAADALSRDPETSKTMQVLPQASYVQPGVTHLHPKVTHQKLQVTHQQPRLTVSARACSEGSIALSDINGKDTQVLPPGASFMVEDGSSTEAVASRVSKELAVISGPMGAGCYHGIVRRAWGQPRLSQPGREGVLAVMSDEEDGGSEDTVGYR